MDTFTSYISSKKLDFVAHTAITNSVKARSKQQLFFIDATAGNGHDTLFLAQLAGENGIVVTFDTQKQALKNTKDRILYASLKSRIIYLLASHHTMYTAYLNSTQNYTSYREENAHLCTAIMFNLGYLPRSNKQIITKPETTIQALECALKLIKTGGIISIHCYSGHKGGLEEKVAIFNWIQKLSSDIWSITLYTQQYKNSEHLLLIQRIK